MWGRLRKEQSRETNFAMSINPNCVNPSNVLQSLVPQCGWSASIVNIKPTAPYVISPSCCEPSEAK